MSIDADPLVALVVTAEINKVVLNLEASTTATKKEVIRERFCMVTYLPPVCLVMG